MECRARGYHTWIQTRVLGNLYRAHQIEYKCEICQLRRVDDMNDTTLLNRRYDDVPPPELPPLPTRDEILRLRQELQDELDQLNRP